MKRSGFTLLEVLIAITVLALITALLVPVSTGADDRGRLQAASWVITSDIELAQVMSIAHPKDPVLVRFNEAAGTYWLAHASDPNTPINREDNGEPYIVTFGQHRAEGAQGVRMQLRNFPSPGDTLRFEPHGGLTTFTTTPGIILRLPNTDFPRIQLSVAPTTGTVTEEYQRSP